jgi:hypothetical protein
MSIHRLSAVLAAVACTAFLVLPAAQVSANTTYYLKDYPGDQGGQHISGTIETDGYIGTFWPSVSGQQHILSWTLAVSGFLLDGAYGGPTDGPPFGFIGQVTTTADGNIVAAWSGCALTVWADYNRFTYVGDQVTVEWTPSNNNECRAWAVYKEHPNSTVFLWDTLPAVDLPNNGWIIAAVPEPASGALALAGLLGGGFWLALRRRRRTA